MTDLSILTSSILWNKGLRRVFRVLTLLLAFLTLYSLYYSVNSESRRTWYVKGEGEQSVIFAGDISYGESYRKSIEKTGQEIVIETRGYDFPAERLLPFLKTASLRIANLETAICNLETSPFRKKKSNIHNNNPDKAIAALANMGINAVNMANNHTMDYGFSGLQETMHHLDEGGIYTFAAGISETEAKDPFAAEVSVGKSALKMLVVGGYWEREHFRDDYKYYADGFQPGINMFNPEKVKEQFSKLREENPTAFIVGYPHFGSSYDWTNDEQRAIAEAMIDSGADMVIGHGAHKFQQLEFYKDKWIIYNLGNFIFLTPGKFEKKKILPYSLLAELTLQSEKKGEIVLGMKLRPIYSNNLQSGFQPYFCDSQQRDKVFSEMVWRGESSLDLRKRVKKEEDDFSPYLHFNIGTYNTETGNIE